MTTATAGCSLIQTLVQTFAAAARAAGTVGLRLSIAFILAVAVVSRAPRATASGPANPVFGLDWYVAPGGSDANGCSAPETPCATIQAAVIRAYAGDTLYVAVGTYTGTGGAVVIIDKDLTLSGGWDTAFSAQTGRSTLDGQGARLGLAHAGLMVAVIERFVIRGGYGGGIENAGDLTLNDSVVTDNTGPAGGGIINRGLLTLNHTAVVHNTGSTGGGLFNDHTALATFNDSSVSGNAADSGGGIYNDHAGHVVLNNSTVAGNTAQWQGGGVYEWACASDPAWYSGSLSLSSSTISGNTAGYEGGGLLNYCGSVMIQNTLLAANTAGEAPDCASLALPLQSAGYNLIGNLSMCPFESGPGDQTNGAAGLGALIGSPPYYPLLAGSAAIDAGNPAGCAGPQGLLPADQRGAARLGRCDIGAYEYTPPGPAARLAAWAGTPQQTPPLNSFGGPLKAAVLDALGSPVGSVVVTFTAPGSGPSGTFAGTGTTVASATTTVTGIATAPVFTANDQAGSYVITGVAEGVASPASFALGNWYAQYLPCMAR